MKEMNLELVGSVIMIHNNQAANPLGPYAKILKPITAKKKKTDADYFELARIEWESGLYLHDGIVQIPARCLERCFWDAAKKSNNGKKWREGAMIYQENHPLSYRGTRIKVEQTNGIPNHKLDPFFFEHSNQDLVKVGTNLVLRTRPIFYDWSLKTQIVYDENVFDGRTVFDTTEIGGKYIGLCERRPRFGRFEVKKI